MIQTREIAQAALRVARHIHDGGYAGVIVSGGSHEVSRALLALGWQTLYPGTLMPHEFVLDSEANALLYKRHATASYPRDFEEWMNRELPGLAASKEKQLCFVDDFALSGEKHRGVGVALRLLGFKNMKFAFFAVKEDLELGRDAVVGVRSLEALTELRHMGQHIQGKEDAYELLDDVAVEAKVLREEALGELRDIGRELKRNR